MGRITGSTLIALLRPRIWIDIPPDGPPAIVCLLDVDGGLLDLTGLYPIDRIAILGGPKVERDSH